MSQIARDPIKLHHQEMSSDANKDTTQNEDRKRRIAAHARVALPLSLSKPKVKDANKSKVQTNGGNGDLAVKKDDDKVDEQTKLQTESVAAQTNDVVDKASDDVSKASSPAPPSVNGHAPTTPQQPATNKKPSQIRTELPPAFVPSSGIPTPQTAGSGTPPYQIPSSTARPVSTQISFISNDSGTSSPNPYSHTNMPPPRQSPHPTTFSPTAFPQQAFAPPGFPHHQYSHSQRSNGNGYHQSRDSYASNDAYESMNGRMYEPEYPTLPVYAYPSPYDPRTDYDGIIALRSYIIPKFLSESFADVELHAYIPRKSFTSTIPGHKLIWARSPTLLKLIISGGQGQGRQQIKIELPGKWADEQALKEAMFSLYGGQLLAQNAVNVHTTIPGDTNDARLRYALAYIAAGQYLGIVPVVQRGMELVPSLFSWDVLPLAIEYALEDGGKHSNFEPASPLALSIADFMANALPPDFQLDTSAPGMQLYRLPEITSTTEQQTNGRPVVHRASRSINDPRLSRLRFGDVGVPTSSATTISSVLISTPASILFPFIGSAALAHRLGSEAVANLTQLLVTVREGRRRKVLSQMRSQPNINVDHFEDLYLEEYVEQDQRTPSGVRIVRRKEN